jgi:hypothetical protein
VDEGFGQYRDEPGGRWRLVSAPVAARVGLAIARRARRAAATVRAAGSLTCVALRVICDLLLR